VTTDAIHIVPDSCNQQAGFIETRFPLRAKYRRRQPGMTMVLRWRQVPTQSHLSSPKRRRRHCETRIGQSASANGIIDRGEGFEKMRERRSETMDAFGLNDSMMTMQG
jgi:hypothetical protein